jgi:hypothetical protein
MEEFLSSEISVTSIRLHGVVSQNLTVFVLIVHANRRKTSYLFLYVAHINLWATQKQQNSVDAFAYLCLLFMLELCVLELIKYIGSSIET